MTTTPTTPHDSLVVGIDGSPNALAAARWAAAYAADRGLAIIALCAHGLPSTLIPIALTGTDAADIVARAQARLDEAEAAMREQAPQVRVVTRTVDAAPARALVDAAESASLLVIGRDASGLGRLGSIADEVVTHATGPVCVVPDTAAATPSATEDAAVVVGVDGSGHSRGTLNEAAAMAEELGAPLTVVHVVTSFPGVLDVVGTEGERLGAAGTATTPEAVDTLVADVRRRHPDLHVTVSALRGTAREALLEAGRGARALVVGRRGHGGFAGLLLGSTARGVAHEAPCPVFIRPR